MSQGLQCWDSNGKLVVDVGDYNLKFYGAIKVPFPYPGQKMVIVNISGMSMNGWLAIPSYGGLNQEKDNLAIVIGDGSFTAIRLSYLGSNDEYLVNIYRYI